MVLDHLVVVDGVDVSPWIESIRADENFNYNEGDKIDITLIHINNMFLGRFQTDHEIKVTLYNEMVHCAGRGRRGETASVRHEFVLADGEVQKVSYKPNRIVVEGVCLVGTLGDALKEDYDAKMKTVTTVVNDLLNMHRDQSAHGDKIKGRVIDITSDHLYDYQWPVFKAGQVSYQTALTHLATKVGAIWFVDEFGIFYFTDPKPQKGTIDLDPYMMDPDEAETVIGHSNIIRVVGSGVYPPSSEYSPLETHERFFAEARNDKSIERHGELVAPVLYDPNLSTQSLVDEKATNLAEFYKIAENVARPKLVGFVPPILSFVKFHAGVTNYSGCPQKITLGEKSELIDGLCVRRIVEYSSRGLLCEIEVATSVPEMGLLYIKGDEDAVILEGGDPDEADEAHIDAVKKLSDDELKDLVEEEEEEEETPVEEEEETLETVEIEIDGRAFRAAVVTEGGAKFLLVPPEIIPSLFDLAKGDRDRRIRAYDTLDTGESWMYYHVDRGESRVVRDRTTLLGWHRVVPWNDPSSTSVAKNLAGGWPAYV